MLFSVWPIKLRVLHITYLYSMPASLEKQMGAYWTPGTARYRSNQLSSSIDTLNVFKHYEQRCNPMNHFPGHTRCNRFQCGFFPRSKYTFGPISVEFVSYVTRVAVKKNNQRWRFKRSCITLAIACCLLLLGMTWCLEEGKRQARSRTLPEAFPVFISNHFM